MDLFVIDRCTNRTAWLGYVLTVAEPTVRLVIGKLTKVIAQAICFDTPEAKTTNPRTIDDLTPEGEAV